jgi:outer membrane protein W
MSASIAASIAALIAASVAASNATRRRRRWLAVAAFAAAVFAAPPGVHADPAAGGLAPAIERPAPAAEAPAAPPLIPPERRPRFYVRLGGARVQLVSQSRELELADIHGAATLAVQNGPIRGSGATIESATIPAAIVGYVLPTADRRWSSELVLGVPFTVKFRATGTLATTSLAPMALGIPTGIEPRGPELGEAQAVPIVVTATYRLIESRHVWPYLGAGPSVLFTRHAKVTNPTLNEVNHPELSIDPAPGLVLQGGIDARLWRSVYARLDVKFIAGMLARAEVRHINIRTPGLPVFDSVEAGTAKLNIWVNPLIVQACVGTDFDLW